MAETLRDTQALGEKTPGTGVGMGGGRQRPMLALLITLPTPCCWESSRTGRAFRSLRRPVWARARCPGLWPRPLSPALRPAPLSPPVAPHPSLRPAQVSSLSGCLFVPSPPVIAGWCLGALWVPGGRCPEAGPRSSSSLPITGPERPPVSCDFSEEGEAARSRDGPSALQKGSLVCRGVGGASPPHTALLR